MAQKFVSVNYDMNSYLPEDSPSTVALDVMEDEFDGGIPNARVLIYNVTVPEALSYKEKLGEIDGVTDVTWLDDAVTEKQVQILKKGRVKKTKVFSYVLLFIDITVVIFHKKVYNAPYPIRMILRNPMQQLQPFSVCYDIYKDCVQ